MELKNVLYIMNYVKNGPKWLENLETINSKKYKSFETFTHLSSDFQLQIPGDPASGIHNRFFQVFTHALLLHFDIIFIDFHAQMDFLGHPKMSAAAHAEIEAFSVYRARYTRKRTSNSRTYAAVFKTVTYKATHMIFN